MSTLLILLYPFIFILIFGYIEKWMHIFMNKSFDRMNYMIWMCISYVIVGATLALVMLISQRYSQYKVIVIAHVVSCSFSIMLWTYYLLSMNNLIFDIPFLLFNGLDYFINMSGLFIIVGFSLAATTSTVILYCKKKKQLKDGVLV